MYADDVKLYTCSVIDSNCTKLQSALDALYEWSALWQLTISHKKCSCMCVGRTNYAVTCNLKLNGDPIKIVDSSKDLGVTVDSSLKFQTHINGIVAKAHARANLIHKCFISKDTCTLVMAFKTYVRPLLEYCSCVWSPYLQTSNRQIESVQRRFTKRLPGLHSLSYLNRLKTLNLKSLETRRLYFDLILVYKIIFNLIDLDVNMFFTFNRAYCTRGHMYKLFPVCTRVDVYKHFFSNRVVEPWNSLPAEPHHFSTLSAFKTFLKSVDLSKFVQQ